MSEFEQDYDKGIDRFLGRFWDKKQAKGTVERIRQEHKRDTSSINFFEELRKPGTGAGAGTGAGGVFRQTVDIPVKYRCQVLVVGGGPAGLSAALGE